MGKITVADATRQINQADATLVKALGFYNLLFCSLLAMLLLAPLIGLSVWLSRAAFNWLGLVSLVAAVGLVVLAVRCWVLALLRRFYGIVAELEAQQYWVYRPSGLYKSIRVSEQRAPASAFSVYSAQQPLSLSTYFHSFNGRGDLRLEI